MDVGAVMDFLENGGSVAVVGDGSRQIREIDSIDVVIVCSILRCFFMLA